MAACLGLRPGIKTALLQEDVAELARRLLLGNQILRLQSPLLGIIPRLHGQKSFTGR